MRAAISWRIWQGRQQLRAQWRQRSLLLLSLVLGLATATAFLFFSVLVRHTLAVPAGLSRTAPYVTLERTQYGAFPIRSPRRITHLLDETSLRGHYGLFAQAQLPLTGDARLPAEANVALISPALFRLFKLPMHAGQPLSETATVARQQAVIAQRWRDAIGYLPTRLRLGSQALDVVGVLDETFCGFGNDCPDIWIADQHAWQTSSDAQKQQGRQAGLSEQERDQEADARNDIFHIIGIQPEGVSAETLQQELSALDPGRLRQPVVVAGNITYLISTRHEQTRLEIVDGLFVDRQEARAKAVAISTLVVASLSLWLLALLGLGVARALALQAALPHLHVRDVLGARRRDWLVWSLVDALALVLPAALAALAGYEALRRGLRVLPGIGVALDQRMDALNLTLSLQLLAVLVCAGMVLSALVLWPRLWRLRRVAGSRLVGHARSWLQPVFLTLAVALLTLSVPLVLQLFALQQDWEQPATVGNVAGITLIQTPRMKSVSTAANAPVTILPTVQEVRGLLQQLPVPATQMFGAPLRAPNRPDQLRLSGAERVATGFQMRVDASFYEFFGLRLHSGRWPENQFLDEAVISQALLSRWGVEAGTVLGQTVVPEHSFDPRPLIIVGVVSDLHFESPRGFPEPMLYRPLHPNSMGVMVAVNSTDPGVINGLIGELHQRGNQPLEAFVVYRQQERLDALNLPFRLLAWLAVWLLGVAMILLLVLIAGTLNLSARSRRRDLAILASLGGGLPAQLWALRRTLFLPLAAGLLLGALGWTGSGWPLSAGGVGMVLGVLGLSGALVLWPLMRRLRRLDLQALLRGT